ARPNHGTPEPGNVAAIRLKSASVRSLASVFIVAPLRALLRPLLLLAVPASHSRAVPAPEPIPCHPISRFSPATARAQNPARHNPAGVDSGSPGSSRAPDCATH